MIELKLNACILWGHWWLPVIYDLKSKEFSSFWSKCPGLILFDGNHLHFDSVV